MLVDAGERRLVQFDVRLVQFDVSENGMVLFDVGKSRLVLMIFC